MTIIAELSKELFGMFVADAKLTLAMLLLVAAVAGLIGGLGVEPLLGGGILLMGILAILVFSAAREARTQVIR
jgi:hypothetical protein